MTHVSIAETFVEAEVVSLMRLIPVDLGNNDEHNYLSLHNRTFVRSLIQIYVYASKLCTQTSLFDSNKQILESGFIIISYKLLTY